VHRIVYVMILVACGRGGASAPGSTPASPASTITEAVQFGRELTAAVATHDVRRAGAVFASDAIVKLVGEPGELRGRAAIEAAFGRLIARYDGASLAVGRVWAGPTGAVVELVIGARSFGLVGAAVLAFDRRGRVVSLRAYVDVPTIVGQLDPTRLPAQLEIRARTTTVPAGTAVVAATGTAREAKNLAVANQIWSQLVAHDTSAVMALAADSYRYEDFAAPTALDRAGTERMVSGFLTAVADFAITDKPFQLAAGDDVVTEVVEHMTFQGRPVVLHAVDVKRFASGKVVLEWQYSNGGEVLTDLLGQPRLTP
jgi:hypothetical protein